MILKADGQVSLKLSFHVGDSSSSDRPPFPARKICLSTKDTKPDGEHHGPDWGAMPPRTSSRPPPPLRAARSSIDPWYGLCTDPGPLDCHVRKQRRAPQTCRASRWLAGKQRARRPVRGRGSCPGIGNGVLFLLPPMIAGIELAGRPGAGSRREEDRPRLVVRACPDGRRVGNETIFWLVVSAARACLCPPACTWCRGSNFFLRTELLVGTSN